MNHLQIGVALQHLRRVAARQQDDERPDGQLLERFAQRRDEAAFAALLRRHGPMVLGVCRGILRQLHDVEDAFQATFLILAQKAGGIRCGDSVGGWLHEVACNVSLKMRARTAVGQAFQPDERAVPDRKTADPLDDLTVRELRQALHEELRQLPEKYRLPLILCYLEGKTQEEAARQLGWPHRRVQDRLQRGREQLRRRLQRRGLAPTVALGTALFTADGVSATMPTMLTAATLRSAVQATPLAPTVAALVETGAALASASKVKTAMVLLLAVSLLTVATSGSLVVLGGRASGPLAATTEPPPAKTDEKLKIAPPRPEAAKTMAIQGRVLGPDGKPKAGAKLLLLSSKGKITSLGVSAGDGRFSFAVPIEMTKDWEHWLIARTEGAGIRFRNLYQWKTDKPVELRLVKDHVIRGRIVTTEGKPVAGARVAAEEIESFANDSLDNFLVAQKNNQFDRPDQNIWSGAGSLIATTTDAEGRFAISGIGCERTVNLRLSGGGIATTSVRVVNRAGFDPKPYNQAFLDRIKGKSHGNWRWWMLSGPDVAVVAQQEKLIRGTVQDADTGKGVPGIVVRLPVDSDESVQFPPEARTDAQGRYEMHGVRKTKRYLIVAVDEAVKGYVHSQIWADDTAAYQPLKADLRVKKGVILTGKVIDGGTGKPIRGFAWPAVLAGNPFVKDYPKFRESFGLSSNLVSSDAGGTFRVATIPGPVVLMGGPSDNPSPVYKRPQPDPKYPQYFSVPDQRRPKDFRINVHPEIGGANGGIPQGNFCKVLEIQPGVTMVKQDIVLERSTVRTMSIQDAEGRPLAGTWTAGFAPENFHSAQRINEASLSVYGERAEPKLLVFYHPEKKLAGTRRLQGDEKEPIPVKLGSMGAIKGRLLDGEGKPRGGITVEVNYRDREAEEVQRASQGHKPIISDANGDFAFDELISGLKFELSFRRGAQRFERERKPAEATIAVQSGHCRDQGSIKLKLVPNNPAD